MMHQRAISQEMMSALLEGELRPLLEAVQWDDTLYLGLRGGSTVNIYYRGGSLFRIKKQASGYQFTFNTGYCVREMDQHLPGKPSLAEAPELIPQYKRAMDAWRRKKSSKAELEFQQQVIRMNNRSKLANSTDYYIADMEYAVNIYGIRSRIDMVGFRWLSEAAVRKNAKAPTLALMELKYGDGALDGASGLVDHLNKMDSLLRESLNVQDLAKDMAEVFRQQCQLGLVEGLRPHQYGEAFAIDCARPLLIFILAEHDPDKRKLLTALATIYDQINVRVYPFDVRIASASLMGSCLFDCQMMTVEEAMEKISMRQI